MNAGLTMALIAVLGLGGSPGVRVANMTPMFPAAAPPKPGTPPPPVETNVRLRSTRALAQRISANGRGEARVTLTRDDVMGGGPQTLKGTLALELPDRVRVDFSDTGERIVVRGDGGEWLQPHLRQMIRLRAEQAGVASWLWDLFLHGGRGRFTERDAGHGRYVLGLRGGEDALPETLVVTVDAAGLPASLDVRDPTLGRSIYRFTGWKFTKARGRTAFVIQPPRGYTVIEDTDGF